MNKDYTTTGPAIKIFSTVFLSLSIVSFTIASIILFANEDIASGFGILIGGIIGSFVIFFFLHGFGELVENSVRQCIYLENISNKLNNLSNNQQNSSAAPVSAPAPTQQQLTDVLRNANNKISAPPATKPTPAPSVQKDPKEEIYQFAVRMYLQRSYKMALNSFLKIPGYKDVDEYVAKINNATQPKPTQPTPTQPAPMEAIPVDDIDEDTTVYQVDLND